MIEVKNVSKKYKDITLFEETSIKFKNGKKILIKGANGTGKSVFLKMLVGYSKIDAGEIIVDSYKIGENNDFMLNAGISINAPEFYGNWTGLENLIYLANIKKIASEDDIFKLAKEFEFENVLNKKYKTYSLGMKQKMRIIQALMDKPNYLILDEPFDALDTKSQQKVFDVLDKYINNDKILIFTSHNSDHEKFADEIYEIENLKIKQLEPKQHYNKNLILK